MEKKDDVKKEVSEAKEKVSEAKDKAVEATKVAAQKTAEGAKIALDKALDKTKEVSNQVGQNTEKLDKFLDEKRAKLGDYKAPITLAVVGTLGYSVFMMPQVLAIGAGLAVLALSPKIIKKIEELKNKKK